MNFKIATHDSATGENGWFITKIFKMFAQTQYKTIQEQLSSGCRFFDIRVRKTNRGWVCAHGLWETKKLAEDILSEINKFDTYCNITYEGFGHKEFINVVNKWISQYKNIKFVDINIKYGKKLKWTNLFHLNEVPGGAKDCFFKLDGSSWHTLIPIPRLWKKIYGPNPIFNDQYFQFVDFL